MSAAQLQRSREYKNRERGPKRREEDNRR